MPEARGFDDPTAFAMKPDIEPMLNMLKKVEAEIHVFAGATAADYQKAQAGAQKYFIPIVPAPQKTTVVPAWLRERTITQSTLHESPLIPIPDDRSSKVPLGAYGSEVITLLPWKHAESDHFIVHYVGDSEARLTMQYIEGVYTVLTTLLNLDSQRAGTKSHVFIFPETAWRDFGAKKGLPPQIAGFAFRTELLLGASTSKQEKATATKVICHEVTHALISRFYPSGRAPLWLNEGLAEYIALRTMRSKGALPPSKAMEAAAPMEHAHGAAAAADARLLGTPDAKIDVAQLFTRVRYGTRTSPDRLVAFYANSQKAVEVLFEKLPVESFARFFNLMIAGNEPGISLTAAYGTQCDGTPAFATILNGR
jgi:hypothetical protein